MALGVLGTLVLAVGIAAMSFVVAVLDAIFAMYETMARSVLSLEERAFILGSFGMINFLFMNEIAMAMAEYSWQYGPNAGLYCIVLFVPMAVAILLGFAFIYDAVRRLGFVFIYDAVRGLVKCIE